ncbi:ABC transporter substrate-binding protein [Sanguibacter suaedae]|jgi:alpha-glucoside transport system substrate-binding protein|uniref:Carbohydrate ABC transporter substrate-binding protein n=1 Tax=Sanguibacter suaedae TaxID=2795737 RepID=A0A934M8H0_9MICO|nr:ABC transporter substrate-binding protein [Sanguibacter suaedae]MBI9113563.1 carbohydrate ABC transporter substrate-binding protein [Sanguibacter suaedae]
MRIATRRSSAVLAGGAALALALTACAPSSNDTDDDGDMTTAAAEVPEIDCSVYDEFGDLDGTTVSVYTSIVEPEQEDQELSYDPFEECTGVTVQYEGSREFEAQLLVRLQAGNAPDIAYVPQPGLLSTIVNDTGAAVPAPDATAANVDEYFSESWKGYGTVDGTFYAAPLGANIKSYVWYSPSAFEEAGYEVPTTWDEMIELSDQIVADGKIPWCAGIASGDATGWPATDWVEDVVLRVAGPDAYDQWTTHEIPFNDPQIVESLDEVANILKNEDYVNAGFGGVDSIAATEWDGAGAPILDGNCSMHRAANFYQNQWPEGTEVAEDGDVYAFYLPSMTEGEKPILGGGEFVVAFDDRPEVQAFQTYLSSADWANVKAAVTTRGGWVSANTGLDSELLATDFDRLSADLLADPEAEFRFDGSDLMPGSVGAGTFWSEMVAFFASDKSSQEVADAIEASWPTS